MPFGVKANIKAPHKFMRMGALCWVTLSNPGGGNDRFEVMGLSRGGRTVTTWIDARDLKNFRAGWIQDGEYPEQPRLSFGTRESAQDWADGLNERFGAQPVRPHAAGFGRP
jgi:hypothetical protein